MPRRENGTVVKIDKFKITAQPIQELKDITNFTSIYNFYDLKIRMPIPILENHLFL